MKTGAKSFRPRVESLESMLLLSTLFAEASKHNKPPAHVAPKPYGELPLVGTIKGTGSVTGNTVSFSASGSIKAIGSTSIKVTGNLAIPTSENVTLSAKKGKVYLTVSQIALANSQTLTYTVTGGTGTYAGATGSGTIQATLGTIKGNKAPITLKFA
jgi:hypothetical protein